MRSSSGPGSPGSWRRSGSRARSPRARDRQVARRRRADGDPSDRRGGLRSRSAVLHGNARPASAASSSMRSATARSSSGAGASPATAASARMAQRSATATRGIAASRGMTDLPKWLAARLATPGSDVEVRTAAKATMVAVGADRVRVTIEAQDGAAEVVEAAGCVLTPPVPQALDLLAAGGSLDRMEAHAIARLRTVDYDPCFAVMLVLDRPSRCRSRAAIQFGGDVPGPVAWIADNHRKGISRRAGAHGACDRGLQPRALRRAARRVAGMLIDAVRPWIDGDPRTAVVERSIHRWKFATPTTVLPEPSWPRRGPPDRLLRRCLRRAAGGRSLFERRHDGHAARGAARRRWAMTDPVDCVVVGAGLAGLACGRARPRGADGPRRGSGRPRGWPGGDRHGRRLSDRPRLPGLQRRLSRGPSAARSRGARTRPVRARGADRRRRAAAARERSVAPAAGGARLRARRHASASPTACGRRGCGRRLSAAVRTGLARSRWSGRRGRAIDARRPRGAGVLGPVHRAVLRAVFRRCVPRARARHVGRRVLVRLRDVRSRPGLPAPGRHGGDPARSWRRLCLPTAVRLRTAVGTGGAGPRGARRRRRDRRRRPSSWQPTCPPPRGSFPRRSPRAGDRDG